MSQSTQLLVNDDDRVGGLDGWIGVPFFPSFASGLLLFACLFPGVGAHRQQKQQRRRLLRLLAGRFGRKRRMDCLCLDSRGRETRELKGESSVLYSGIGWRAGWPCSLFLEVWVASGGRLLRDDLDRVGLLVRSRWLAMVSQPPSVAA